MNDAADGRDINQLVQERPTLSAQTFDPSLRRSNRQRDHQEETEHPDGYKGARVHILNSALQIELAVEPDVGHEVQEAVEEGVESEHASKLDDPLHARNFSDGRDRERDEQED